MDRNAHKPTTQELEQTLWQVADAASLASYLDMLDQLPHYDSFLAYYGSLRKVLKKTPAQIRLASEINRTYCYHVFNGTKLPGRDKILRLCLAAGLDVAETQRGLDAGRVPALSAWNRRDVVIRYAITQQLSVAETNQLLTEYAVEPLT